MKEIIKWLLFILIFILIFSLQLELNNLRKILFEEDRLDREFNYKCDMNIIKRLDEK